ncbi:tRNA-guanine transglycosylase [Hesseltinella vesiculosa]|uniref:Queuine tRNA-ribosyltransferase accessory subunit 2 n=1 Tax=Hesseltinella vesiculosa TaxID=101127 RepID=A0A1X2GH45_9FUNG|nr:tRNA-guanine transglycosylase [Hesseltinella vesiculosa]
MHKMSGTVSFACLNESKNATSKLYPRRGTLQFIQKNKTIQTPACLAYTVRGAIPHLIVENTKDLPVDMYHLSLEHFLEEKDPSSLKYPHGLHKYINQEGKLLFCDLRDPQRKKLTSPNTNKFLNVDTHGGTRQVTPDFWGKILKAYRPDMANVMHDTIDDKAPGKKRIRKSVDRSLLWLDACLEHAKETSTPVFASVAGHTSEEERRRSTAETIKRDVQGFSLDLFGMDPANFDTLLQASMDQLPVDKPRLAYGLIYPEHILLGVRQGVDLFDGSYPQKMTDRGRAITMKFGSTSAQDGKQDKSLNLWDRKYARVFEPLDKSCGCYACKNGQTKAYIHHLLNAHEMLASIFLMGHNVYQMNEFMQDIRHSIDTDTFDLATKTFMSQYNHDKEPDGAVGHEDEIDAEALGVTVKKKRTLSYST